MLVKEERGERVMAEDIERVCPRYHKAIELVGRRWNGSIIHCLLEGPRRFGTLLEGVPGLHDRLLSERLKELESEGIVRRRVYPETPVRIEYELTQKGRDLERIVTEVHRWADRWVPAPVHARHRR
jgi:DNA-binding HxlR family transcriptional regulator